MAVRIRKDNKTIVCAAEFPKEEGDCYLDDGVHYCLSVEMGVLKTDDEGDTWYFTNPELEAESSPSLKASNGSLRKQNRQLLAELTELRRDRERLDWLEEQSGYTHRWIARGSTTGRGFRLHNTSRPEAVPTAREAIDRAMESKCES